MMEKVWVQVSLPGQQTNEELKAQADPLDLVLCLLQFHHPSPPCLQISSLAGINQKRGSKEKEEQEKETIIKSKKVKPKPIFYEFLGTAKVNMGDFNLIPASSSSGSSGITEAAS